MGWERSENLGGFVTLTERMKLFSIAPLQIRGN